LSFEFGNNAWLGAGRITRTFILKDGLPVKIEGDKVNWLKPKPEGILSLILSETQNQ
jgi:hypothetical protein